MNPRSRLSTTAVVSLTSVLLLTGCGGGDGDGGAQAADKASSAPTTTGASVSASPSASGSASSGGRPRITLPSDVTLTFEGGRTGDAVKDAVLADGAEMTRAVDAAIAGTDPKGEGNQQDTRHQGQLRHVQHQARQELRRCLADITDHFHQGGGSVSAVVRIETLRAGDHVVSSRFRPSRQVRHSIQTWVSVLLRSL